MISTALVTALFLSSTTVDLTVCEAIRQAARENTWPVAIDDDVPCGERRALALPDPEKRRRSSHWALQEAVSYEGLLVEEHRAGSRVRRPTPDEATFVQEVAQRCRVPITHSLVVSVQTTRAGTRGWVTVSPANAERAPAGQCVKGAFDDVTRPRFPDDTVVNLRVGSARVTTLVARDDDKGDADERDIALARAMKEHGPRVMRCFAQAGDARGVASQVTVRFAIQGGSVRDVEIVSKTAEGDVSGCVVDRLQTAHFDDPLLEGQRLTYTFRHTIRAPMLGGVPDEMP